MADARQNMSPLGQGGFFLEPIAPPGIRVGRSERYRRSYAIALYITPGLLHMTFGKLTEEAAQELVIPSGLLELSLHRAFGTFELSQVEGQPT